MSRRVSRRRAYEVVDQFEDALAEYTGAPFVITTDSCTHAIMLSLVWLKRTDGRTAFVEMPQRCYVGVYRAIEQAGFIPRLRDFRWSGQFRFPPFELWDSAKRFTRGMYASYEPGAIVCVSFGWSKPMPIGRGGAILLDDLDAWTWLRAARMDGRLEDEAYEVSRFQANGFHCNLQGDDAARGLHLLTYRDDAASDTWATYPDLGEADWLDE